DLLQACVYEPLRPARGPTRQQPRPARCEHGNAGEQERSPGDAGENDPENADGDHHPPDLARQIGDTQNGLVTLRCFFRRQVDSTRRRRTPRAFGSRRDVIDWIDRRHAVVSLASISLSVIALREVTVDRAPPYPAAFGR